MINACVMLVKTPFQYRRVCPSSERRTQTNEGELLLMGCC